MEKDRFDVRRRGAHGIKPYVIPPVVCAREHLVSRTLSTYVTSVSFRVATSAVINHAARATADTVRRLACLMTGQSAPARALTFAFAYVHRGPVSRRSGGEGRTKETLFSYSCDGRSAERRAPSPCIEIGGDKRTPGFARLEWLCATVF